MKSILNLKELFIKDTLKSNSQNAKVHFKVLEILEITLISLLTAALSLFLFSCEDNIKVEPAAAISFKQNEVQKVRMVGQWLSEGKREGLVKDFARLYEFENQHIMVDLKFPEEIMQNHADRTSNVRFVAEQVNKAIPDWDIIRLNNQLSAIGIQLNNPEWAKENLVDFSEIPGFKENTNPKLLTQKVKDAWGGIIPGPFLEGSYWSLWTNIEVEQKIGIQVKRKGMTFDDFLSYLKAVQQYNETHSSDYIVPIHEAGDWQTSFVFVFQLFASALNNNELLFSKEIGEEKLVAWQKTLKALEEIAKCNAYSSNWQQEVWAKSNQDLPNKKCLFYSNGSWMYNIWEQENPEEITNIYPNEYPSFNESKVYPSAYFIVWGVLKNSPNRDEAVKMLMAMNSPDMADQWVQTTKCPTGINGNMTDVMFGKDQYDDFSVHIQNNYSDNNYNFSEELCQNIIGSPDMAKNHYRDVLEGNMTADEAMELIRTNLIN